MNKTEKSLLYPEQVAREYFASGVWTTETFAEFFHTARDRHGEQEALVGKDLAGQEYRLSYTQLAELIDQAAGALAARGVGAADYVLVQLPNVVEYVVTIGALFQLGARPVLCLPAHRQAELSSFLTATQARHLITCTRWQGFDHGLLADELAATYPGLQPLALSRLSELVGGEHSPVPVADLAAVDIAFLQVSGGTTGIPKLIARSHADYLYSVRESAKICRCEQRTRFLVVLPISHNFTMSSPGILGVWYAGGTVILCADPSPSASFALIDKESVTMTALVPPLLNLWLAVRKTTQADLSSLELLQVGGAKLNPSLASRVSPELGARLQQVFGMAEGLVCYTREDDPEEILIHSQGLPISALDEIRIVDDADHVVPEGHRGHLLTRGPYTIRGYFGGVSPHSFTEDGFYRTGDIVRRLRSGHLVVEGRDKDQINRAGEKISAEEIEDHLLTHPQVFDAALVGVPDERLGERCVAFIVATGDVPTTQQLRAHLRARGVAHFKIPDEFEITQAFPVTGVGKTSRKQLRALLKAHATS